MMTLFTSIAPIILGFIAKLIALKSQAASENQKLMIQSLQVRNESINQARDRADNESPMAAWNRRVIIFVILGLVIFTTFFDTLVTWTKEDSDHTVDFDTVCDQYEYDESEEDESDEDLDEDEDEEPEE